MNSYSIKGFDHCELYVSNAKQAAHYYRTALGFLPIAYCGLETGSRDRVSYVSKQNQVRFVFTSPLENNSEISKHIYTHGDGIKMYHLPWIMQKQHGKNPLNAGLKVY